MNARPFDSVLQVLSFQYIFSLNFFFSLFQLGWFLLKDRDNSYWEFPLFSLDHRTPFSVFLYSWWEILDSPIVFSFSCCCRTVSLENDREGKKTQKNNEIFFSFSTGPFSQLCGQKDKAEPGTCASPYTELWDPLL